MNLTDLQYSAFLKALGWAIANSLWQAALLWIVYIIINGSFKNLSAKIKTNLSTALLFSVFVWFVVTFFTKYISFQAEVSSPAVFTEVSTLYKNAADSFYNLVKVKATFILPYLSVGYLCLLVLLSLRLINSYRFIYFIKNSGLQKPAAEWKLFTENAARQIGIARNIKLWISTYVDVPATIGFFKPVILIPVATINNLSPDQLEAIILHELAHIHRNDYVINLIISVIETVLFFNPFMLLLSKIIKKERENYCDDFVIQYQYDPHTYASALLSLEKYRNVTMRLAVSSTSGKKQLLHRVKRIMEVKKQSNFNYGQKLLAMIFVTFVLLSISWFSPKKDTAQRAYKPTAIFSLKNKNLSGENNKVSPLLLPAKKNESPLLKSDKLKNINDNTDEEKLSIDIPETFDFVQEENPTPAKTLAPEKVEKPRSNGFGYSYTNDEDFKSESKTYRTYQELLKQTQMPFADLQKLAQQKTMSAVDIEKLAKRYTQQYQFEYGDSKAFEEFLRRNETEVVLLSPSPGTQGAQKNTNESKAVEIRRVKVAPLKTSQIFARNNVHLAMDSVFFKSPAITGTVNNRLMNLYQRMPNKNGFAFTTKKPNNTNISIITNSKTGKQSIVVKQLNKEEKVEIEYRNGAVIINGQKVIIPDTDKILSQINIKKLISEAGKELEQLNLLQTITSEK